MQRLLLRVAFFGAVFSLQCCVNVLGTISRDTIFLRSYKASSVAALTLLLSFSTAVVLTRVTAGMGRLKHQLKASNGLLYALCPAVLAVGLLLLSLASLGMPQIARVLSVLIYGWLDIATQVLTQQFWDLCARAFDVSQAKKYFGFITFGSTLGSLLASMLVLPVVQQRSLPTEFNLIVASAIQFVVAVVLFASADRFVSSETPAKPTASNKQQAAGDNNQNVVSEIQTRTYLQHICFFELMATVVRVLVDNTTLSVLAQQDEDAVKSSLTRINSVQSVLMIPMQLASGPFFTRFGVMYGISLLPITVFLFGGSTYMSSSATSLVLTRALYNAVSLAIFNPARELLWLPFNASDRSRFKGFVVGPFRSFARIFGAVFAMVLTAEFVVPFIGYAAGSVIMAVGAIAWFIDALAARQSYAAEFYASLRQGYLDLTSPLVDFTPDQILLVKETLVTGAQNQVNYVLSSLSHEHIGLFAQELRALFNKKNRDNVSVTPLHTKLRLINLHTAAKRQFVLYAQESYTLPDRSTFPSGIFNTMDLMMIVKDKSVAVPRQLRVAAILACGYEKFNTDAEKCSEMLSKIIQSADEDQSVVVCAAVALLRLSDWMNEEANLILQRLLHEETGSESRVVCLKIVGKELPELLGDGYLVYLLHHKSPQIVQAAVECCSHSSRNSRMLLPALVKHLPNSMLRPQIVAALKWFDPAALWATLCQFTESSIQVIAPSHKAPSLNISDTLQHRREALSGSLKVLQMVNFPLEDKLKFLLQLVDTLVVAPNEEVEKDDSGDILHQLFSKDAVVEELVVDALLLLISSTNAKTLQSLLAPLHSALDIKIREAYEMRHVLELFNDICPRTASNIEETSPLLLQHVEHSLKDTLRMLLKLLSTGFPKEFNVSVILEGLQSDLPQVHSAIQEVLENLLPSSYKNIVLPLLFPKLSTTKAKGKMEKEIAAYFGHQNGVDLLLTTMRRQQPHLELSALALQYFLHIAGDHAEFLDENMLFSFQVDIISELLKNELTRELLIETCHSRPDVLPYESLAELQDCTPPLISRIAISNCLRVSSLFESVCAIGILRILAHHFVPIKVKKGETFAVEGDLATAMYVVATGKVQLHKEHRILAELGYGSCVGQAALLQYSSHAGAHITSSTALSDCILLSVSRDALDALMIETPSVSRGVLNSVAFSIRWLYFEPLQAIAQAGSLPRRDRTSSMTVSSSFYRSSEGSMRPIVEMTETLSTNLKAALSVDRAAKSFLYNIGRSRSPKAAPKSAPSGTRARNQSLQLSSSNSMPSLSSRPVGGPTDGADFTTFEKCIHLKGSQLMKNLDDDKCLPFFKVSAVANISHVISLGHGELLYTDGAAGEHVYVIIEGTIAITAKSEHDDLDHENVVELHDGDSLGEESFVGNTQMQGNAAAVGRVTLFQITTKELVDLSELHHDIMHVIVAWLAQKLATSTETMIAPLLSPTAGGSAHQSRFWDDQDQDEMGSSPRAASRVANRGPRSRAETS